jgi:hypothetical protein
VSAARSCSLRRSSDGRHLNSSRRTTQPPSRVRPLSTTMPRPPGGSDLTSSIIELRSRTGTSPSDASSVRTQRELVETAASSKQARQGMDAASSTRCKSTHDDRSAATSRRISLG